MNKCRVIVTTSGKGGVGKTTTSASIALGLAKEGKKVCAIDFDIGLRNLDLVCGLENRVVYDLITVIRNECTVNQALIRHKLSNNFYIIAASQTRDKDALDIEGVGRVIDELKNMGFEYIICDSPAGIEKGAMTALYYAHEAIIVTNPEISSVRDSDRIIGLLNSKSRASEKGDEEVKRHLLITRYDEKQSKKGSHMSKDDICEILGFEKPIGIIPNDENVIKQSNSGIPVIDGDTAAARAYKDVVQHILGNDVGLKIHKNRSFFKKLFGG